MDPLTRYIQENATSRDTLASDTSEPINLGQQPRPIDIPIVGLTRPSISEPEEQAQNIPPIGPTPDPLTGDSTIIADSGDALQLSLTASSSRFATSLDLPHASYFDHHNTEDKESSKVPGSLDDRDSQEDHDVEGLQSEPLLNTLRASRIKSQNNDGHYFIPLDKLDVLITRDTIYKELRRLKIGSREECRTLAKEIWKAPSREKKTTRRKIFAVLVLMDKVAEIRDFVEEAIYDSNLPFIFAGDYTDVCFKSSRVPVKLFRNGTKWKHHEKDIFDTYQWELMTPYFRLSYEEDQNIHRMPVEDRATLPFTEVNLMSEGGFSMVRKVKIHPAHYNATENSTEEPYFAVKTLKFGADVDALKNREVQSLIRLNSANNPNLIKLLVTFQHKEQLHLVFPWADGNLQDFWKEKFPDPHLPPRDHSLAKWVAQQCLGLALGLQAIHHNPIDVSRAQKQGLQPDTSRRKHGRHGDFKPENVLWFRQNGTSAPSGIL